jgi:hypothetical protein
VDQGIFGLVGFGFDGPRGSIPSSLTAAGYNGTDVGKAVLSSIFAQDPSKGQFFAFSLSRVGDVQDSADASLVISGYDDKYSAVQSAPLLPQFPVNSGRWSVLTEGISVGGLAIPWTSLGSDAPGGQTAVLFDTGICRFSFPHMFLFQPNLLSRYHEFPCSGGGLFLFFSFSFCPTLLICAIRFETRSIPLFLARSLPRTHPFVNNFCRFQYSHSPSLS